MSFQKRIILFASAYWQHKASVLSYYVVEIARIGRNIGVVCQIHLGTTERVAVVIKDATVPIPLSATPNAFGLFDAHWLAADSSGAFGDRFASARYPFLPLYGVLFSTGRQASTNFPKSI